MAKFAPVCPLRILRRLPNGGGYYHLILAHDVLNNPDEFRLWSTTGATIILDNSVTELGTAVNTEVIREAANISRATVIILPDVYNDKLSTMINCKKALDEWPAALLNREVMFVPQGNTMQEFLECAEYLATDPRISWWGVPRNITDKPAIGSRYQAAHLLRMLNPARKMHLLGFSNNIADDMLCSHLPFVEGIDSAVPIRAATLGKPMSLILDMPPRGDWWDTAQYVPLMSANYMTTRRWANIW